MSANLDIPTSQNSEIPNSPSNSVHDFKDDYLMDQATVKRKFGGKSNMWIWRRINDGTLPKPIKLNGRNHWKHSTIKPIFESLGL